MFIHYISVNNNGVFSSGKLRKNNHSYLKVITGEAGEKIHLACMGIAVAMKKDGIKIKTYSISSVLSDQLNLRDADAEWYHIHLDKTSEPLSAPLVSLLRTLAFTGRNVLMSLHDNEIEDLIYRLNNQSVIL
ncbi:hypothetical protein [Serratia symbiotica]|uniref:hypothetical protein n=1 Tax=Serratia symbiotica TaxID=138074 RepID=UPI001328A8BE|nr:hypothetical protein [Serratia symbiotica]QTP13379.1 hypothetical protein GPZ83_0000120 [Serratia symbiotica]